MLSRRELIGKAAVGATAALTLSAARTGLASVSGRALPAPTDDPAGSRGAPGDPADGRAATDAPAGDREGRNTEPPPADPVAITAPPPWALLSPLVAGAVVAHGWRLADLSPVQDGSCVVTLENERGRAHRVHLCRNDGTPQGLVYTRRLDLVVMNEGKGDLPTEESLAQAVAALAHVVAANEGRAPEGFHGDLLPHAERLRRFAAASADGPSGDGRLR